MIISSVAFLGVAENLEKILTEFPSEKDLQELLTKAYSKKSLKKDLKIKVDSVSNLFQNLNGATGKHSRIFSHIHWI